MTTVPTTIAAQLDERQRNVLIQRLEHRTTILNQLAEIGLLKNIHMQSTGDPIARPRRP